ncbi:MAG TPA: tRNA (adenosine(37)-N6)-threonylcarbamoyltransferase complex ATPase subunit type 1 TsaE [Longimicrobiales bacterium]|nr:tRNA (adenosine(37)-N6)-threonylcarbamoyltransferase complex ATPase subunit type 1 TsaE [Longimicrobiales bacterium]
MSVDFEAGMLAEADVVGWGGRIGAAAVGDDAGLPLVLALRGELGAGKSVLARAIARGAGVTSPMPSPTFNLVFRYDGGGGIALYHVDLYRLNHADEVWELGWREFGSGRQIVLIEWPERAEALLPADRWDVWLSPTPRRGDVEGAAGRARLRGQAGSGPEAGGGRAGSGARDLRWVWGARRGAVADIPGPEA